MGNIGLLAPLENPPPVWHGATPVLSVDSLQKLAFVIFIVILLTQFPTQHRYTDWRGGGGRRGGLDLWITKIPYKAIQGLWNFKGRVTAGRAALERFSVVNFFSPPSPLYPSARFGGNSIKIFKSVPINSIPNNPEEKR